MKQDNHFERMFAVYLSATIIIQMGQIIYSLNIYNFSRKGLGYWKVELSKVLYLEVGVGD